jgi:hypothetical protein
MQHASAALRIMDYLADVRMCMLCTGYQPSMAPHSMLLRCAAACVPAGTRASSQRAATAPGHPQVTAHTGPAAAARLAARAAGSAGATWSPHHPAHHAPRHGERHTALPPSTPAVVWRTKQAASRVLPLPVWAAPTHPALRIGPPTASMIHHRRCPRTRRTRARSGAPGRTRCPPPQPAGGVARCQQAAASALVPAGSVRVVVAVAVAVV